MSTSACNIQCEAKSGYSIFPVRLGALPKDSAFAPQGAASCQDAPAAIVGKYQAQLGPKPTQSRYVLRMLRKGGYLYVYCKGKAPGKQWQAYYTSDQGALIPIQGNTGHNTAFSCSKSAGHPHNVRTVCIANPDKAGETWIGFSANYWDAAFCSKFVEADPAKLGMVKVDLKAAPTPAQGSMQATADTISNYVADFAASNANPDGKVATSPLWDDKTCGPQGTKGNATAMAATMQAQAAADPSTKGKTALLVLPDTIGLAVDLNAHRQMVNLWQQNVLGKKYEWEIKSDSILNGFERSVDAGDQRVQNYLQKVGESAVARAGTHTSSIVSLATWLESENRGGNAGLHWQALDDVPNSSVRNPGFIVQEGELRRERDKGKKEWKKLEAQLLNVQERALWKTKFAKATEEALKKTESYEGDWLSLLQAPAFHAVFDTHWDSAAPNAKVSASAVNHGELYTQSADAAYNPQPLSGPEMTQRYLEATINQDPGKPSAVFLRALCGNQKSLYDYGKPAYDFLAGGLLREEEGNARDKGYDIVKGLITVSGLAQYRWMTAASAGFSLGLVGAVVAAVGSVAISPTGRYDAVAPQRWAPRLIGIQWLQQLVAKATDIAQNMPLLKAASKVQLVRGAATMTMAHMLGAIPLPQLVYRKMSAQEALKITGARQVTTRSERRVMNSLASEVTVAQIVMVAPQATQGKAGTALQEVYSKALEVRAGDVATGKTPLKSVAKGGAELLHELPLERNLARGAILVQGIGLFAARENIAKWLDGQDVEMKDKLGIVDSAAGFATGMLALYQVASRATMVASMAGNVGAIVTAQEASLRLYAAASAAQLLGVVAGLANVGIAELSRRAAVDKGNDEGRRAYAAAQTLFVAGTGIQVVVATNVLTRGAVNRLVQSLLLRGLSVAITTAGLSTAWTGIGIVLFIGGTALMFVGSQSERTALEAWIERSKFGNAKDPFRTLDQETTALDAALKEAEAAVKHANASPRVARPAPAANAPMAY